MSRYSSPSVPLVTRNKPLISDYQGPTYLYRDEQGQWGGTTTPPQVGYWGITNIEKLKAAADVMPGHPLTWVANTVADVIGSDKRFVSLTHAFKERHAAFGSSTGSADGPVNGWKWLSNRFGVIQDISEIERSLDFMDEDFNAEQALAEMFEASPSLQAAMEQAGVDPAMLLEARNRDQFVYLTNRTLAHAQTMQRIDEYTNQGSLLGRAISTGHSAIQNYLLTDPTFAPSMMIGVGGGTLAAQGGRAGVHIRRAGFATAAATGRATGSINAALAVNRGGTAIAHGAHWALRAPAAVHGAVAARTGALTANAIELGAYGVAWNAMDQAERIRHWNTIFDSDDWQTGFSWAELGLAGTIGAALGYGLGAAANRFLHRNEARKAIVEGTDFGTRTDPMAVNSRYVAAQARMDMGAIKAQRAIENMTDGDYSSLSWALDKQAIDDMGLTFYAVTDFFETVAEGLGGLKLRPEAVGRMVREMYDDADAFVTKAGSLPQGPDRQVHKAAFQSAYGRAAEELPATATNLQVQKRAFELYPDEIKNLRAKLNKMKTRSTAELSDEAKANLPKTIQRLQAEAAEFVQTAQRRDLTDPELERLSFVSRQLEEFGEQPVSFAVSVKNHQQFRPLGYDPSRFKSKTKEGKALQQIVRENGTIQELENLANRTPEQTKELKRAYSRRNNAVKRLGPGVAMTAEEAELAQTTAVRSLKDVMAKWGTSPPKNPKERQEALFELFEAVGGADGSTVSDSHAGAKAARLLGLDRWWDRLARDLPFSAGEHLTVKSKMALIRRITQELDDNKFSIESLDPTWANAHPTATHAAWEAERLWLPIANEIGRLVDKGKFGSRWRPNKFRKNIERFEAEVTDHAAGIRQSSDPDVAAVAALWDDARTKIWDMGKASGQFTGKRDPNYFPFRANADAIYDNETQAHRDLAAKFSEMWTTGSRSQEVHWDTLVNMGLAERVIDPNDAQRVSRWRGKGALEGKTDKDITQRSQLEELKLADDYTRALTEAKDEFGFTALEQSARRATTHLIGDATIEQTSGGLVRARRTQQAASNMERQIPIEVVNDPKTAWMFRKDFTGQIREYMSTTGTRVMNNLNAQKSWSVPGITREDVFDAAEAYLLRGESDSVVRKQIKDGINQLRRKNLMLNGRLPSPEDAAQTISRTMGRIGEAGAGIVIGPTIGQSSIAELISAPLWYVKHPSVVMRSIIGALRYAAAPRSVGREELVDLAVSQHLFTAQSLNRFTGNPTYSGLHYDTVNKVVAPFHRAWQVMRGKTPEGRTAAGVPGVMNAYAQGQMTIGGMDYLTNMSRTVHSVALQSEVGRFFKASEKLADSLRRNDAALGNAYKQAYEASIAAGNKAETAQRKAKAAKAKLFRKLARESGFGGDWGPALRYSESGMLTPENMAILRRAGEATGALKDGGFFKHLDTHKLREFRTNPNVTREELQAFDQAYTAYLNMAEEQIRRRVSMMGILQTPTDESARSFTGRLMSSMTTYARSFYHNNIVNAAAMPLGTAAAGLGMMVFGEALNQFIRELYRGHNPDEVLADWSENPMNTAQRLVLRVPWTGSGNTFAQYAADAVTAGSRRHRSRFHESAATGSMESIQNTLLDGIHWLSPLAGDDVEDFNPASLRFLHSVYPGARSLWWGMGAYAANEVANIDIRPEPPNRYGRGGVRESAGFRRQPRGPLGELSITQPSAGLKPALLPEE